MELKVSNVLIYFCTLVTVVLSSSNYFRQKSPYPMALSNKTYKGMVLKYNKNDDLLILFKTSKKTLIQTIKLQSNIQFKSIWKYYFGAIIEFKWRVHSNKAHKSTITGNPKSSLLWIITTRHLRTGGQTIKALFIIPVRIREIIISLGQTYTDYKSHKYSRFFLRLHHGIPKKLKKLESLLGKFIPLIMLTAKIHKMKEENIKSQDPLRKSVNFLKKKTAKVEIVTMTTWSRMKSHTNTTFLA